MTEAEWLACTDPLLMLKFLRRNASDRKFRLYLCGGCRSIAHLFFRPESLTAVEVSERFADGEASEEERARAEWWAEEPTFGYEFDKEVLSYSSPYKMDVIPRLVEMGALPDSVKAGDEWQVEDAVRERLLAAASLAEFCADHSPREAEWAIGYILKVDWPCHWLCDCVFGNPFRPVLVDSVWLVWNTSTVVKLSQAIYEDRAFDHLPILADALEDAGCTNADILTHCRGSGPHVRGCWVIDLLLGKN